LHDDLGPDANLGSHLHLPTVFAYGVRIGDQTQAHFYPVTAPKGDVEQPIKVLGSDAYTGVADTDTKNFLFRPRAQGNRACLFDRRERIRYQV
tara:strand:- start:258 stop:536 length:279 start_codon:yes stop_codon:yes gene_type:complete